ncbi:MAG: type II secretion system F family protein [Bdellovibrionaceae bacterium]|nr:type II secretion system F family protein [Pseudobdellovibrionaceae bacterium]
MPVFEYKGLNRAGKNIRGAIDAENSRAARMRLKKDGIFVVDLKDKKKGAEGAGKKKSTISNTSVSIKEMALMTRQLAVLIRANIPLVDALGAVSEQVEVPALAEAVADCKNMVNEGMPLHKSLAKYPKMFDNIFVSMVEAGEMSGTLDVILIRLAEFKEAANELRTKVKSALTYPAIMLVATMGLLGFLFTYLVPKMQAIFDSDPELTMPWYTQMVFSISGLMVNYWYIFLIVGFGAYALFISWKNSATGRPQWDAIALRIPIFGDVNRLVAVARFTRTLSTLLNGGVPMLTALQIVRNVVDNDVIARAIDEARSNISEGEGISGPLKKSGQFPAIVIHMVSIGEKTGELESMLIQVADAFDFQVKAKIDAMTSLINPLILIIMGGTIAMIIFSVMMPMFEMTSRMG